MIVKQKDSTQYSMFPEYKPLYVLCRTCARLVPDGICKRCREEIHTKTPWYRISQFPNRVNRSKTDRKQGKLGKKALSRKAAAIIEQYKLR
jgi:hypothetical protein